VSSEYKENAFNIYSDYQEARIGPPALKVISLSVDGKVRQG